MKYLRIFFICSVNFEKGMSFFVSDSLKDRLTEKELVKEKDAPLDSSNALVIFRGDEETTIKSHIVSVKIKNPGELSVCFVSNLSVLERIFFKKVKSSEIVIGNTILKIMSSDFLSFERKNNEYVIKMLLKSRGF